MDVDDYQGRIDYVRPCKPHTDPIHPQPFKRTEDIIREKRRQMQAEHMQAQTTAPTMTTRVETKQEIAWRTWN
eukprot:7052911-Prorocentrum_lima.AAC.1